MKIEIITLSGDGPCRWWQRHGWSKWQVHHSKPLIFWFRRCGKCGLEQNRVIRNRVRRDDEDPQSD